MEENKVYEIDVLQLCKALLKKWWALLLPAILCAALMLGYTKFFVTPMYQSTAKMYINASSNNNVIDISGLTTARDLVETYAYLAKNTRLTLEEVAQKADVPYTYERLRGMVSISGGGNTEFLEITVTNADPTEAALIANVMAEVLKDRAIGLGLKSSLTLADPAVVPKYASSPDVGTKTAIGFLIGLLLGAAVVILFELFNDKIRSEEWLAQTFKDDIPLLAVIPSAERVERRYGRYGKYSRYYRSYSSYKLERRQDENR